MALQKPAGTVVERVDEDERLASVESLDDVDAQSLPDLREPSEAFAVVSGRRVFLEPAAHQTWRVIARNREYAGETEGFGFNRGEAVIPALPVNVRCPHESAERCERSGTICRLHTRLLRLNNLTNYPFASRQLNQRTKRVRTVMTPGYEVLSEAEYEARYGDRDDDYEAIDEL